MSRRIIQQVLTRMVGRRLGPTDRVFKPSYTGLGDYLSSKYGIHRDDVTAILFDIFRYIEMEVLAGRGRFHVPRFGAFSRREIGHGLEDGESTSSTVMRFTRAGIHRPQSDGHSGTFIDWEDEEWVDE